LQRRERFALEPLISRGPPVSSYYYEGEVTQTYTYDAQQRLVSTLRDGLLVDERKYDAAGRLLESGPRGLSQDLLDQLKLKTERQVSVYRRPPFSE
jgi:hypothetical protein